VKQVCCLALSLCSILPSPAWAQGAAQSESVALVGGLSYGAANTLFSPEGFEVVTGPAGTRAVPGHERGVGKLAFFGTTITRRVAIMFETDYTGAGASGFSSRHMTVGARYRPGSRVWLGGGAGWGSLRHQADSNSEALGLEHGLALSAAAGFEVLHWKLFALDLQARVSTATYGQLRVTRTAILLGYEVWVPLG